MPGGGLEQAPAGWSVLGPGPTLVLVSVAGVLGGASGGKPDAAVDGAVAEAAGGARTFLPQYFDLPPSLHLPLKFIWFGRGWLEVESRFLPGRELLPDLQPGSASHYIPPGPHCLSPSAVVHPHHDILHHVAHFSIQASVENIPL